MYERNASSRTLLSQMPLHALKGVGPVVAQKCAKIGVYTVQDLLFHLPLRYQDRTRITPIVALRPGQEAVLEGSVVGVEVLLGRRRSLLVRLHDASGSVHLRFYHFSAAQRTALKSGVRLVVYGQARLGAVGLELYHPQYHILQEGAPVVLETALTPVYPTTDGLTQARLWQLTEQALALLLPDSLPDWLLGKTQLFGSLEEAIRSVHRPSKAAELQELSVGSHWAQRRLAFEEMLAHQLSLQRLRQALRARAAPALPVNNSLTKELLAQLGFVPTRAQQRVAAEIGEDLAHPQPMLRLVQGDVGSGKTLIAALAAAQAIAAGYQVALMAPTELLAEQHMATFARWFEPLGIPVVWLTGSAKKAARTKAQQQIAQGVPMVIGTHALFQEGVIFARLALVIIDEQHRFGVQQRLALRDKAGGLLCPHQLTLTATPIPRTLAMSAYADLDTSVLDELPPGRTPVHTLVVANTRLTEVLERVQAACMEKRQVYWVCTLIEDSEDLEYQAAESRFTLLQEVLPRLAVGLVHGRMKAVEKAAVMAEFAAGRVQLLVATTVIEVGVDVAAASLMIIENPERLGLAQLHQLRGRVGRGRALSHCILLYQPPLSALAQQRLAILRSTSDGFVIAEQDLALRGPGEILGTRQTGAVAFKIADLMRDADLLPAVRDMANSLWRTDPEQVDCLIERWLGESQEYAQV